MNDVEDRSAASESPWFLRRRQDEIRGPVSAETLRQWAESAEIVTGQEVSADCKTWQPVESLPELEMVWFSEEKDGSEYGPFNILAASRLVEKGVLESDSVIRKREPEAAPSGADGTSEEEDPAFRNRITHLEEELLQLRDQLKSIEKQDVGLESEPARTLTQTDRSFVSIDQSTGSQSVQDSEPTAREGSAEIVHPVARRPQQDWRLSTALYAKPEKPHYDDASYIIDDSDKLHEMARTRRFRAHSLRWNAITSSIILGAGVTVGSLGYMLELTPMQFSGVIIALGGVAYLLIASVALLIGYMVSRVAMRVSAHETAAPAELETEHRPLKGALNITFYWFNRTFRSRQ